MNSLPNSNHTTIFDLAWFQRLVPEQQVLVESGMILLKRAHQGSSSSKLADYSYLVFPIAKAYEGFLKKFLLDMGLISDKVYHSKRFRLGKSINPDISHRYRGRDWVYDDLSLACGQNMAERLWQAWLNCRNRVFHFFPGQTQVMTLAEAQKKVEYLLETMEIATACALSTNSK